MIGMRHSLTFRRFASGVDANYTASGAIAAVATCNGYVHEYSATELPGAGALGQKTVGRGVIPYGVGPIREQDLCDVTFRDGSTRTFRVVAVRDDHIMQRLDLERVVR